MTEAGKPQSERHSQPLREKSTAAKPVRFLWPLVFVLLTLAGIAVVVVHDYRANRSMALKFSEDLLASLERQVVEELDMFLRSASSMADFLARLARQSDRIQLDNPRLLDQVASDLLRTHEQLAMFNIADTEGQFLMPKKMPDGSIDTKQILIEDGRRRVSWLRRSLDGRLERVEPVSGDTYDPRERPWYRGAARTGELYWTDVYVFWTDRKPGITAAAPVYDQSNQLRGVLGLDVELSALSEFLSRLEVGRNGLVVIISQEGKLVAHPDRKQMLQQVGGKLELANVAEIDSPALERAYNQYRLGGPGRRTFELNGENYISLATQLPEDLQQPWVVLLVVPESDFVGIVASNTWRSAGIALGLIALSAAVGAVVVVTGLRADRRAAAAWQQRERMESYTAGLVASACQAARAGDSGTDEPGRVLQRMCDIVDVSGVSVWQIDPKRKLLVLISVCHRGTTRPGGLNLPLESVERVKDGIEKGEPLAVDRALRDSTTSGLVEPYLRVSDVRSVLIVPVPDEGPRRRMLMFEEIREVHHWSDDQIRFATSAGQVYAAHDMPEEQGWSGQDDEDTGPGTSGEYRSVREDPRRESVRRKAASKDDAHSADQEQRWSDAVVLVLSFAGERMDQVPEALAQCRQTGAIDRFVSAAAKEYGSSMTAWDGGQFVALFTDSTQSREDRVDSAVKMATCITEDLPGWAGDDADVPEPRGGMDVGSACVTRGSADPTHLLLTGLAVRRARMLSSTASPGSIQFTQGVRPLLPGDTPVHVRGRFLSDTMEKVEVYSLGARSG